MGGAGGGVKEVAAVRERPGRVALGVLAKGLEMTGPGRGAGEVSAQKGLKDGARSIYGGVESHKRIFTSSRGGCRLIPLAKVATKF